MGCVCAPQQAAKGSAVCCLAHPASSWQEAGHRRSQRSLDTCKLCRDQSCLALCSRVQGGDADTGLKALCKYVEPVLAVFALRYPTKKVGRVPTTYGP